MNLFYAASTRRWMAVLALIIWCSCSIASDSDEMTHKVLACAGCHEYQYSEQKSYAPSIGGKPVEYLYQQLLNYRAGRRLNSTMEHMLAYLSDDYLHDIASHYASLPADDHEPRHSPLKQTSAQAATQTAMGRLIVQTGSSAPACIECHGNDLRGDGVAIPGLRGLSPNYIAAQLGAWQSGARHAREPDCMKEVANHLSGEEINALAHWIAHSFVEAETPSSSDTTLPLPCGAVQ